MRAVNDLSEAASLPLHPYLPSLRAPSMLVARSSDVPGNGGSGACRSTGERQPGPPSPWPPEIEVQEGWGILRKSLPVAVAYPLHRALRQLAPRGADEFERHVFALSRVTTLSCGREWGYPTALLFAGASERDRIWIPHTDEDIGCIHADSWLARRAACDAFLERQFLMASRYGMALQGIRLDLELEEVGSALQEMIVLLTECGALNAWFHVDGTHGYFALVSFEGSGVAGLQSVLEVAYRSCALSALTHAVGEVWRRLRRAGGLRADVPSAPAPADCSHAPGTQSLGALIDLPVRTENDPFAPIRTRSDSAVVFEGECESGLFCRLADPGFYLHGNPVKPVNRDNPFAAALGLNQPLARPMH